MNNAITREKAIETLYSLINSGILSVDVEDDLQEIANAINNERYGLHMWGADDKEYDFLATSVRADLVTDEYKAEGERIWNKYSFKPSPHEEKEINENITEAAE